MANAATWAHRIDSAVQTGQRTANSISDYAGSLTEIGGDVGNVASQVADFATQAAGALEDPLQALISHGLDFLLDYIQPLRDMLDSVTGDPAALSSAKDNYTNIGNELSQLHQDLANTVQQGTQNWQGNAADAASQKMDKFTKGIDGTATVANNISTLCDCSAQLMQAAQDIIKQIISDFVEWLIITWVAALASSVVTLGGSDAAATAATVGEAANATEKGTEAVNTVQKIIKSIEEVFSKIKNVLKDIRQSVGEFTKESKTFQKIAENKGGSFKDFAKREGGSVKDAATQLGKSELSTIANGAQNNGTQESAGQIDSQLGSFNTNSPGATNAPGTDPAYQT